ncbi:transposase [Candidatus Regiella insecticola]|uniref:Transposase n=2 Tax=Candidatus Regiella insecticola TaxID=138073 RepID=A0A6L2ZQL8_9ENTR|nr:transposase [Candidatus Regiella insecticola]
MDESGFAHDMPRLYGYSVKGKRCYGQHDWHAKARTNVIGAQLNGKLTTVSTFDCHINSDIFHAWVMQDLLPKSPQGAVIVMDNVSFHKRQDTQAAIQKAGFILEYLPTYSPDRNRGQTLKTVISVVRGWVNYHGISDNQRRVGQFIHQSRRIIFKWFNRKGGRRRMKWEKLDLILKMLGYPAKWKTRSLFQPR